MKKFVKYFVFILLASAMVFTSCSKDDDDPPTPTVTAFNIMTDYMIANNMDVDVVINGWIIDADGVNAKGTDAYYIIDIRSQEVFDESRIEGAVHGSLGTILEDAALADNPILVVCYTGQSASHAVIALRLSGYTDAKVLKWGMSGWNSSLSAPWNDAVGNTAVEYASSWAAAPGNITSSIVFSTLPNIQSTSSDGATILAERVAAMIANGFSGILNTDVLANPTDYFINNYWTEADVVEYGNIQPAYRLNPFTLADETYKNLDPSKTIVSYCWTGQTSSMLTAYLHVLGYDSKSLKFGVNSMIYDDLHSHKWAEPETDYPIDTTK